MFAVIVHVVSASKFDMSVLSALMCHGCAVHRCATPPSGTNSWTGQSKGLTVEGEADKLAALDAADADADTVSAAEQSLQKVKTAIKRRSDGGKHM